MWGLLGVAGSSLMIFFVGLYLAIDPLLYRNGFVALFPASSRPRIAATLEEAGTMLARWLLGKLCLMCFVGLFTATGLWLLGIPLMVGKAIGGVIVFAGGLPLYADDGKIVGGLGLRGDTSCTDHVRDHRGSVEAIPNRPKR